MDSKKRLYIGDFLAEGSSKAVFKVGASIRSDPNYSIITANHNFTLSQTELNRIFVEVDPSINSDDVVVARSEFYNYEDYVKTINDIKLHLMFAKSGNAPQIYGILFFIELKNQKKYLIKSLDINDVENNIPRPYFVDCYINMFVFQEKCVNDLKTHISNIYNKITKISSSIQNYDFLIDTFLNKMVDEEITEHLDTSIGNYIDTLQTIELDYKPANICLQKIETTVSVSASASASASYKWTSFDYDMNFTREFGHIPEDLIADGKSVKSEFAKYAKLYMKIIFFVSLSYSFRTNQTSGKIKQITDKIKTILSEKIQNMYGISYDIILETLHFFNDFGLYRKYSFLKIFSGKHTPEYMLEFYAEQYFGYNGIGKVILPISIKDIYNSALGPKERTTILICYILQIPTLKLSSLTKSPENNTQPLTPSENNTQPILAENNTQPTPPLSPENNIKIQDGGRRRKKSKKKKQTKRRKTKHVKK